MSENPTIHMAGFRNIEMPGNPGFRHFVWNLRGCRTAFLDSNGLVNTVPYDIFRPPPEVCFVWTPHPVIVTIGENSNYIRVLL